MKSGIAVAILLSSVFSVLKTNLLQFVEIGGVMPDIPLIILVYVANKNGSFPGECVGFGGGLITDVLSLAPLGFHAFINASVGFLTGLSHNRIFLDPIFIPMIVVAVATLVKTLIAGLISVVFGIETLAVGLLSYRFVIELVYNTILAPPVFAALGLIGPLEMKSRRD